MKTVSGAVWAPCWSSCLPPVCRRENSFAKRSDVVLLALLFSHFGPGGAKQHESRLLGCQPTMQPGHSGDEKTHKQTLKQVLCPDTCTVHVVHTRTYKRIHHHCVFLWSSIEDSAGWLWSVEEWVWHPSGAPQKARHTEHDTQPHHCGGTSYVWNIYTHESATSLS